MVVAGQVPAVAAADSSGMVPGMGTVGMLARQAYHGPPAVGVKERPRVTLLPAHLLFLACMPLA